MMTDDLEIPEQTYSLLLEAKRIRDDGDEAVVISDKTLKNVRDLLEPAVEATTGLSSAESLSLRQLSEQLAVEEDALETLCQQPETGGGSDTDIDTDPADVKEALAGLEQSEAHTVRQNLAKAQTLSARLPEHSDSLKRSAAATLGVSTDEIDEQLLDEIPSDVRLV